MKNLTDIQKEIKKLVAQYSAVYGSEDLAERKRVSAELAKLRNTRDYLLTQPTEDFIKSEIERLQKLLNTLDDRFFDWRQSNSDGLTMLQQKTRYKTEFGINVIKKQISFLKASL